MDIEKTLKAAYLFGRDNGEGRSDKNFNDFLETTIAKETKQHDFILKSKLESIKKHIDDVTPSFANIQYIYNLVADDEKNEVIG